MFGILQWGIAIWSCFSQLGHMAFSRNFFSAIIIKNHKTPWDSPWSKKSLQQAKQWVENGRDKREREKKWGR
jgi:hypothetical protein